MNTPDYADTIVRSIGYIGAFIPDDFKPKPTDLPSEFSVPELSSWQERGEEERAPKERFSEAFHGLKRQLNVIGDCLMELCDNDATALKNKMNKNFTYSSEYDVIDSQSIAVALANTKLFMKRMIAESERMNLVPAREQAQRERASALLTQLNAFTDALGISAQKADPKFRQAMDTYFSWLYQGRQK